MPDGSTGVEPRLRVAIVGGGIAGLTLAIALRPEKDGISPVQIDLYEAGPEITTVGAGISVWPRTWEIMRELGLYEDLAAQSVRTGAGTKDCNERIDDEEVKLKPGFVFRKSDWPREGYEFGHILIPNGATTMHRADMVEVFVRHLPHNCSVHTSKRLIKYNESSQSDGPFTLNFEDGSTAEADVLIGADGIKSKTRATMYQYAHARECLRDSEARSKDECERCKRASPRWTGTLAYRYLIPVEKMKAVNPYNHALTVKAPMSYSGKGKHIITYPISHGKFLNWIGFVTVPGAEGTPYPRKWVTDADRDELVAHFTGWEPEVDEMLSCVEKPTLWAIHEMNDLPFSVSGRVALMGDAVHAMTTHFGAGGGQAIEDAYILGLLLRDPRTTLAQVANILCVYESVRLPFARSVVQNANRAGKMYEFGCSGLYDGTDFADMGETHRQLAELDRAIVEIWEWQWKEPVQDQWREAERMMEKTLETAAHSKASSSSPSQWRFCSIM